MNNKNGEISNWKQFADNELEMVESAWGNVLDRNFGNLQPAKSDDGNAENQDRRAHGPRRSKYSGFFYGLLAALTFSAAAFVSKILAKRNYHTFNIALWKYQGMTILGPFLLLYYACKNNGKIFKSVWPLTPTSTKCLIFLVIRGSFGVCTMILHTNSLKYLSLADSAVIAYSTPIAVVILARIFLKEAFGVVSILLAVVTFLGVCVLARPPLLTGQETFDINTLIGVGYAFAAMVTLSGVFIVIRHIREVHFSLFIMFYGYVGTLECSILALSFGVLDIPQTTSDWLIAGGNALLSFAGQIFITCALQAEFAGLVSLVRTGDVVFAFIWQMFIGIYPDLLSLVGASIVVSTILCSGFTKWIGSLPLDDPRRKKLSVFLK